MPERYTQKDAIACGNRLANVFGIRFGNCRDAPEGKPCWDVSCMPMYDGCVIVEVTPPSGGESRPLGDIRMPPRRFCQGVWMSENAIRVYEELLKQE